MSASPVPFAASPEPAAAGGSFAPRRGRSAAAPPPVPARLGAFSAAAEAYFDGSVQSFPRRSRQALQRPTLFYPGLAARAVHDRRRFPWVAALEAAFPAIRRELVALLGGGGADFASVHRAHTSAGEWAAAFLWVFGQEVAATCGSCPRTARALRRIPGVAQFGTALFSGLAPGSRIAPHHGFTNAKLRCQLPLLVPGGGCKLQVGGRAVTQREGRCIVFDDSYLHSAWNDGDAPRFVLVFDFFHPDLTAPEVAWLAALAERRRLAGAYLSGAVAGAAGGWVRDAAPRGAGAAEGSAPASLQAPA